MTGEMVFPSEGIEKNVCPTTPDEMREWFAKNKTVRLVDKRMSVKDAVSKFVKDGDYLGLGCFGHIRVGMAPLYEIVRQGRRDLRVAGHTAVHDLDILLAGGCVSHVDVAYSFGHELRPIRTKVASRLIKAGKLKTTECSNASFSYRYKAAANGISFMPIRMTLGTDTFLHSPFKVVICPFTGKKYCAVPALYPDVAIIHVHKADMYGNCQIEGITVADWDLARAAKRLIISTEEIVDEKVIRKMPHLTTIPYYTVDAVCEVRYGSHPCEMPYRYWFDEPHIKEYLEAAQTEQGTEAYVKKYVLGTKDFSDYLHMVGGEKRMRELEDIEDLKKVAENPWAGAKGGD